MELDVMLGMMGSGFVLTMQLFALTLLGSLPLGIIVALMRMSDIRPFRFLDRNGDAGSVAKFISRFNPVGLIARFYISLLRGTPLMLQMFAIYFAPYYLFDMSLSPSSKWTATVIAFILNYAAYFAEIYRSGIQSIPRGQYEAAQVLGYSRAQTFMKIVLPQVVKRIMPAMGNEVITLVKDTSLAFAIGVAEMFSVSKGLVAGGNGFFPFVLAAAFYWVFNMLVELVVGFIEKRLSYYHD